MTLDESIRQAVDSLIAMPTEELHKQLEHHKGGDIARAFTEIMEFTTSDEYKQVVHQRDKAIIDEVMNRIRARFKDHDFYIGIDVYLYDYRNEIFIMIDNAVLFHSEEYISFTLELKQNLLWPKDIYEIDFAYLGNIKEEDQYMKYFGDMVE